MSDVLERIENGELIVKISTKPVMSEKFGCHMSKEINSTELIDLAKLGKQMQWVSVNTPPKIEDVYLVRYSSGYKTTQAYSVVGSFCGGITHWMPLPPNLKEEE